MTEALRRRVEALRAPLQRASADGFGALAQMGDLGATLRAACDRLVEVAPPKDAAPFVGWRKTLAAFEALDRSRQAVEVARGLRLCQTLAGRAPAPAPPRAPLTWREAAEGAGVAGAEVLLAPTQSLPGIGPALAARLAERGIETVEDLVWLVPRRYDDARRVAPLGAALAAASPGDRLTAAGTVAAARFSRGRRARWVEVRLVDDADPRARLVIRWFNAHPSMAARFPKGVALAISGPLSVRGGAAELTNPDVLAVGAADAEAAARIIPRYADIPGVPPATVRKACVAAAERAAGHIPDGVPAAVADRLGLCSLAEALAALHAPPPTLSVKEVETLDAGASAWHRRLAFDELFVLGLAVARRRRQRRADVAAPCPATPEASAAVEGALPFSLTGAQRRAIAAIAADLGAPVPMNRLLQGDVGSGKTAVALAAAYQTAAAGGQVALMAPTEILAEQHFASLEPWCRALGMRAALLTASTPRGVRASTLSMLGAGQLDLIIGTHALLAEGVVFARLGLVVIDEQHRFGVAQRVRLRGKSDDGAPHLLVMTATPIPRTLALTAYGDLDVTTIDELPPGRTPPRTQVLAGAAGRRRAYARVAERVAAGERAFVVCPLVEPSPDDETRRDWADATSMAGALAEELAPARVALAHGRMPQAERQAAMARFGDGDADVLVATTVVEVGVDVPAATVMVIEDAQSFGLAQLHQLRGRVGRGGGASWCLLLSRGRGTDAARRRLEVMAETCDGFRIAEEDLALRGPGELLGVRQAGLPKLRFGDLREHTELLVLARQEADRVIAADPELSLPEHRATRLVLAMRAGDGEAVAYGAEGG